MFWPQQIELIQKLRMHRQFAFQRRWQPVFDQFAQLLQQLLRARGLLRRLPAQRKDLLKLIERQYRHNRSSMGIEELGFWPMQILPEAVARQDRARAHFVIGACGFKSLPHLVNQHGRPCVETQAQVHRQIAGPAQIRKHARIQQRRFSQS